MGLLPSGGKREYDGFRAWFRDVTAAQSAARATLGWGIVGILLISASCCLDDDPYGGLRRESIEIPRPFSSPMRLA